MSHFYQEQFMLCLVAGVYCTQLMECKAWIRLNYICSLSLAQQQSASTYCFPTGSVLPYNLYIYIHRNTVPLIYLLYALICPPDISTLQQQLDNITKGAQYVFSGYIQKLPSPLQTISQFFKLFFVDWGLLIILSQLIKMKNLWEILIFM